LRIPDGVIEEISRKADIVEVVGNYVSLKKRGGRYWGLSPFTHEKTPSFSVSPEKGLYYCFSSNRGGSIFNFIMEMERLTFPEAVEFLGKRYGVEVATETSREDEGTKSVREILNGIARSFHYFLTETPQGGNARGYLEERGHTEAVIKRFQLGYAPGDPFWLRRFLSSKGYDDETLDKAGLFTQANPRRALFADRLVFPIRSNSGDVVAFGGRRLKEEGPKYLNSPESSLFKKRSLLYGLFEGNAALRKERRAFLVEGYTDVLAFHEAGIENVVAPLGTAFTEDQARVIRRLCDEVVIVFDADEAGSKALARGAGVAEAAGLAVRTVKLAPGQDPADILRSGGVRELQNALSFDLDVFQTLLDTMIDKVDAETPQGKEFVLTELLPYINSINSAVRRESTLSALADRLNVQLSSIIRDIERAKSRERDIHTPEAKGETDELPLDLRAMVAAAANPEQFGFFRQWVNSEDLESPEARELYAVLEDGFRRGTTRLEVVLSRLDDEALRTVVAARASGEEFTKDPEKVVRDAVYRLRGQTLNRRRKKVQSALKSGGFADDQNTLDELLQEKMFLDAELEKLRVRVNDGTTK
jgi:DNA primase